MPVVLAGYGGVLQPERDDVGDEVVLVVPDRGDDRLLGLEATSDWSLSESLTQCTLATA